MKKYVASNWIHIICRFIATLGPIGYLPAPGTLGTVCTLPLVFWFARNKHLFYVDEGVVMAFFALVAVWITGKAAEVMASNDPSEIVLDEVVGFCVTMLFFPLKPVVLVIGFFYFRFFDIVKPFGIYRLEGLPGGWGIVLDDLAAAFFARFLLTVTLRVLWL